MRSSLLFRRLSVHTFAGRAALGAVVALPLLTACGSDSGLSKEQFLAKGNAVCAASNDRIDALAAKTFPDSGAPDPAATKTFLDSIQAEIRGQIDDLGKLKPPKELKGKVDELLAEVETAYGKMVAGIKADPDAFLAQSGDDPFVRANQLSTEVGLNDCAG